jgi:hypothetical protein
VRRQYLGDSFDLVKQTLLRGLAHAGRWQAHPMFTEQVAPNEADQLSRLLGVPLVSRDVLEPRTDREKYFAPAREADTHVFLDPDTGFRLEAIRGRRAPSFLFNDDLVKIAKARPGRLCLVFDQSLGYGNAQAELTSKLRGLDGAGLCGAAYVSHACFLLVAGDTEILSRAIVALQDGVGLPPSRLLRMPATERKRMASTPPTDDAAQTPMASLRTLDPDPWSTYLSGEIQATAYADMVRNKDRLAIAALLRKRFTERYLDPAFASPERHGFTMMAICCLMVETLESFRHGWRDTAERGKSEAAFCSFFQAHEEFRDLRPHAHEFYRAVRCGILHQAETTHSWRVHRGSGLFVERSGVRWLSAFEFGQALRLVVNRYCEELSSSDWASPLWVNARKKLQAICKNCGVLDVSALA